MTLLLLSGSLYPRSWVFFIVVTTLGLITGSFLNAVIHRLPRGISLLDPKRSFCPGCRKMIPWQENLPVFSWLILRGHCSGCAMPISARYPLVELLTAGLYLLAWERFGLPLTVVFWIFLSLLVSATFIDCEHLIIPDELTLGGMGAGILFATLLPELLEATHWWEGLLFSAFGAVTGYFLLWGVVELGKKAFGHRRIACEELLQLDLVNSEVNGFLEGANQTTLMLRLGAEELPFEELFSRKSDRVEAACDWLEIQGERFGIGNLSLDHDKVRFEDREWQISEIVGDTALHAGVFVRAGVSELILPREAMGFGDVKFLACIGAFLGWKGVLFSLFAGSLLGAVIGIAMLLATQGRSGRRIPFGPYLALGASIWIFAGPELVSLYFSRLHGEVFFLLSPYLPV